MSGSASHHRRQYLELGAIFKSHYLIHNLLYCLALHRTATIVAFLNADTGVEETQVIVNFGDGAHSGAGISAGGFLLYGNGW